MFIIYTDNINTGFIEFLFCFVLVICEILLWIHLYKYFISLFKKLKLSYKKLRNIFEFNYKETVIENTDIVNIIMYKFYFII